MKRFHLSTLLLLTVLAGAFVGANMWKRDHPLTDIDAFIVGRVYEDPHFEYGDTSSRWATVGWVQGWPYPAVYSFKFRRQTWSGGSPQDGSWIAGPEQTWSGTDRENLGTNIAIGLAALALAGYVSEKLARRKKSV